MLVKHINEADFKECYVEFDDLHYELAKLMCESLSNTVNTPIVSRDRKALVFCIDMGNTRYDKESGKQAYRIRIEKIND